VLAELRRVLEPGGRLGLLAFLADGPLPPPLPEGNEFSSRTSSTTCSVRPDSGCAQDAGRVAGRTRRCPGGPHRPVEDALARRHGEDPRWQTAQEQTARVARLISGGHLRPTLLHAVAD
jgi:hypothetical protein